MLSSRAIFDNGARPSLIGTLLGMLVPQQPLHRMTFGLVAMCLASVVIGMTLFAHTQGNQVFLVASMASVQQPVRTSAITPVATSTTTQGSVNATKALVRLNQSSVAQYANQSERDLWWPSTCSTASMTEVINSYGYHYRITDVLRVESRIGEITADSGLLHENGIDHTATQFGFNTTTLTHPTLDQVIDTANHGKPVIVNFPPQTWTGGHFLVVTGGTDTTVHLADSSILNNGKGLQEVSREYFLTYWRGFAKILFPSPYLITHTPTVTADQINAVLAYHHSPASGSGQVVYTLGVKYGIDPAYVVITFQHESTFGLKGEAAKTLSPGNLRCIANAACVNTASQPCQTNQSCYASFPSWSAGFEALYQLLASNVYVGDGLVTPELIIPRFAPQSDDNNEAAYIQALERGIDAFRAGSLAL